MIIKVTSNEREPSQDVARSPCGTHSALCLCREPHFTGGSECCPMWTRGKGNLLEHFCSASFLFFFRNLNVPSPIKRPLFRSLCPQLLLVITVGFWFSTPLSFSSYLFNVGDAFRKISFYCCNPYTHTYFTLILVDCNFIFVFCFAH